MSRIQIKVMLYLFIAWHDGKPFIAVLVLYNLQCKWWCMCGGAPYILQVRTCMGLAEALGMRQARPCYWSQTVTTTEFFQIRDREKN